MSNVFTAKILRKFKKQVPELQKAVESLSPKLEPTLIPPFEMLIRSIVYQQLSGKAAKTIHDRMLKLVGKLTPNSVLAKTQEELKSVGLSRQKASYLHNVAEAFRRGGFLWKYRSLESLSDLSSVEIIRRMRPSRASADCSVEKDTPNVKGLIVFWPSWQLYVHTSIKADVKMNNRTVFFLIFRPSRDLLMKLFFLIQAEISRYIQEKVLRLIHVVDINRVSLFFKEICWLRCGFWC